MAGLGPGRFADCAGLSGKAKERLDSGMEQMSRHFASAFSCVPALLFALAMFLNAAQREQPSFDCRKAATVPEKAICANAELSRLDVQLSRTWKTLLNAFSDSGQRARMKADERAWIAHREECGDNANCMGKLYRDQISALTEISVSLSRKRAGKTEPSTLIFKSSPEDSACPDNSEVHLPSLGPIG